MNKCRDWSSLSDGLELEANTSFGGLTRENWAALHKTSKIISREKIHKMLFPLLDTCAEWNLSFLYHSTTIKISSCIFIYSTLIIHQTTVSLLKYTNQSTIHSAFRTLIHWCQVNIPSNVVSFVNLVCT